MKDDESDFVDFLSNDPEASSLYFQTLANRVSEPHGRWQSFLPAILGVSVQGLNLLFVFLQTQTRISGSTYWNTVESMILVAGAIVLALLYVVMQVLPAMRQFTLSKVFVVTAMAASTVAMLIAYGCAAWLEASCQAKIRAMLVDQQGAGIRWILFDPPGYNPMTNPVSMPTEEQLRLDLRRLRQIKLKAPGNGLDEDGIPLFNGIITFHSEGTLASIPRLAKEEGFERVIMGIHVEASFHSTPPKPDFQSAISARKFVDAYCLGHNASNTLPLEILGRWMHDLRSETGLPTSTTASLTSYTGQHGAGLQAIGDFYMPDILPSWANRKTPRELSIDVQESIAIAATLPRDKQVLLTMIAWPSGGDDTVGFSEVNQAREFENMLRGLSLPEGIYLAWGMGFDCPWKGTRDFAPGDPFTGFFKVDGQPKPVIDVLQRGVPSQSRP